VIKGELLHIDFYQTRKEEKIKADIPLVLVGEAPAMQLKSRMLTQTLTSLSIECLPDKLPPQIEVDLSPLDDVEKSIHVRDIILDPDIAVLIDPDQMVAKVIEARVKEEVEAEVEEEVAEEAGEPAAGEAE